MSISAMGRGVCMCMNAGTVCYSCLVGAKRVGGTGRIFFFWINFDYRWCYLLDGRNG